MPSPAPLDDIRVFLTTNSLLDYPSGIAVYTNRLLRELSQSSNVRLYSGLASVRPELHKRLQAALNSTAPSLIYSRVWLPGRVAERVPRLARLLAQPALSEMNVLHATDYLPPTWVKAKRTVLTIHDLGFLRYPTKGFTSWTVLAKYLPDVARRADAICVVSEFTKREVCHLLQIQEERVFTVHLAPQFNGIPISKTVAEAVITKYGLERENYFLSVGMIQPRKNYSNLLDAFLVFRQDHAQAKLVIAGTLGWNSQSIVERIQAHPEAIVWIRNCPLEDLPALYTGARGMFLVSWYEGFGLPITEAMACGCAVCYGLGSSMEEVAGDAGLGVRPDDVHAITAAFDRLWNDDALRADLIRRGYEKIKFFSWRQTAEKTLQVYRYAMDNPNPLATCFDGL